MPDLSREASHQFWSEYPDKIIYKVIAMMEGVEAWTLDGDPELEKALTELGQELDDLEKVDFDELKHEDNFIDIVSAVCTTRGLRLLQAIDTAQPGAASKLLSYAEEQSESPEDRAGLFLRRNIVFERLRLLGRVFSKERLQLVSGVLDGEE